MSSPPRLTGECDSWEAQLYINLLVLFDADNMYDGTSVQTPSVPRAELLVLILYLLAQTIFISAQIADKELGLLIRASCIQVILCYEHLNRSLWQENKLGQLVKGRNIATLT